MLISIFQFTPPLPNIIWYCLHMESKKKKRYKWTYIQNWDTVTDVANKLTVTQGKMFTVQCRAFLGGLLLIMAMGNWYMAHYRCSIKYGLYFFSLLLPNIPDHLVPEVITLGKGFCGKSWRQLISLLPDKWLSRPWYPNQRRRQPLTRGALFAERGLGAAFGSAQPRLSLPPCQWKAGLSTQGTQMTVTWADCLSSTSDHHSTALHSIKGVRQKSGMF